MASLYKRPNSPFWWVSKKEAGVWVKRRTHWRTNCPVGTANARTYVAQQTLVETQSKELHADNAWVKPMIQSLPVSERSILRYGEAWKMLDLFMAHHRISIAEFNAHRADLYLGWRQSTPFFRHKKICKNTALQELKFLKFLQKQARLRGKMTDRPMDDYVIRLAPKKIKPALTNEQIEQIRAELPKYPSWMSISFEIGLATGARLQECSIPCDCIDLGRKTITFPCPKGGVEKAFTIPIPKAIYGLLAVIKASGAVKTCEIPKTKASVKWRRLFDRLGMKDICFHCLRVTRVTRLRQAGVPPPDARRLVNHSSELIHRLYDRHQVEELRQYVDCGNTLSATPQSLLERLRPQSAETLAA